MIKTINENNNPSFLDYREKNSFLYHSKETKTLNPGDVVVDRYNTYGYVKYISDTKGALIRFVDDIEIFESELNYKVEKINSANINQYNYQEKYFKHITQMGKVILEALEKYVPYVNMFNDGNNIYIRASTFKNIVDHFTTTQLGDNHTFISIKLSPMFDFEFQEFKVRKADRGKDKFALEALRYLFRSISNNMKGPNRFKYKITTSEDTYNRIFWDLIGKEFRKFQLHFIGYHHEYQQRMKKGWRDSSIEDQDEKEENQFRSTKFR